MKGLSYECMVHCLVQQSRTVRSVTGEESRKESTGQNCFRFLIPVSKVQDNELAASLLKNTGLDGLHAFTASDRRLVFYPCRQGQLLNVVGIHPSGGDTSAKESSWLDSLEHLFKTYKDFGPEIREKCRLGECEAVESRIPFPPSKVC